MRAYPLALAALLAVAAHNAGAAADEPIAVTPHAGAGKFVLKHDPDRPLLAFYGGVGLRKLPDGNWTGYAQQSPADVEYLIRRCAENGIKRIYASVQEEGYPSAIAPPASGVAPIDYVGLCVRLAHENNIQFYADQPTFGNVLERNGPFTKANPQVFGRSVSGEVDTHMLSAAWPEVRRLKRSLLMELVQNYPVDGLQLDFIRFPCYSSDLRIGYGVHGYDEPTLRAFRAVYGYADDYRPAPDDPRWVKMKSQLVSQFIRELRGDLKASGIDLPIGVFNSGMYGRADSLRSVHQDWRAWEEEALVDEHCPMFYMSNGMTNLVNAVRSLAAVKRPAGRIVGPIFLSEGFARGEPATEAAVRDAARRLIKLGCDELWFCRASEIESFNLWPVVKEISNWSIRDIRAQDFDPAFENLVANGDFAAGLDGWAVAGSATPATGGNGVTLAGDASSPARIARSIPFRPIPHLALDSLSIAARARVASGTATLSVRYAYADGTTETLSRELPPTPDRQRVTLEAKARTDFKKLVVVEATVAIEAPAGTTVELDDVVVERDQHVDRGGVGR